MSGAPLHILMHCVYFPPEVGGLESHVYYLCRALAAEGHRVDIVTSHSIASSPQHEVMDGVYVWRTWFPSKTPVGWIAHSVGSIPQTRSLARNADIVHAQAFASVLPASMAARSRGAPFLTTWHTSHFLMRAESPVWRPIFRRMLRRADHNLAASVEIADVANAIEPRPGTEALTNGVETDIFRPVEPSLPAPESGRRRLIVPRRLYPKNGVEYAVRAIPAIAERHNVEVVFVGDGPEREKLVGLAGELGVSDRVRFLGARPNAEMPGLLASAELAIFPSLMEATSVAALECMSCELPVAASNVGGLPEIVDDSVGGLFEPADPASLAARVSDLLDEPDGLRARGVAGRTRVVDHWSNRRLALRHLEIYQEQLARRRGGRSLVTHGRTDGA